jgi:hypothetical protein
LTWDIGSLHKSVIRTSGRKAASDVNLLGRKIPDIGPLAPTCPHKPRTSPAQAPAQAPLGGELRNREFKHSAPPLFQDTPAYWQHYWKSRGRRGGSAMHTAAAPTVGFSFAADLLSWPAPARDARRPGPKEHLSMCSTAAAFRWHLHPISHVRFKLPARNLNT